MQLTYLCFLLCIFMTIAQHIQAQEHPADTSHFRIETKDGNEYIGQVISENDDVLVLRTASIGDITIRIADIRQRQKIDHLKVVSGEYWTDNPQSTRYFFSPNGYGLKKGEGYYQNVWLLFNQLSVGVTNHFSIGGGLVPLFLFGGAATPVWITPKFSIPVSKDKLNLGIGALAGVIIGDDGDNSEAESNNGFGILYGTSTFGSRNKNLTVGLGYGFSGSGWARSPTITVSGMTRLNPRWYLITENYYIDAGGETTLLISGGARVILGKKAGLDFGLAAPFYNDMGTFIAVPWLGLTIPFRPRQK